jgi:DNA/RNA endonuclease YhcR with UshA esterase domain/HKD family nuclease
MSNKPGYGKASSKRDRKRAMSLAAVLAMAIGMLVVPAASGLAQTASRPATRSSAGGPGFPTVQATSDTHLLVEPSAGPTPIVDAIEGAKHSIDLEMYLITDHRVEQALIAAAARGVKVRVILDRTPEGLVSDAVTADQLLAQNGVDVHYAPSRFTFDHSKAMVIDNRLAFIGSANDTYDGLDHNREYVVETNSPAVVDTLLDVFSADWNGRPVGAAPRSTLILSPHSQHDFVALIDHARRDLLIEEEESPDPALKAALAAAAKRGVDVTLVEAATSSNVSGVGAYELSQLSQSGVHVVIVRHPYIHAKLIISDRDVFIGSENMSFTSLEDNREIGVIWKNPPFLATLMDQVHQDAAGGSPVSAVVPHPVSSSILAVLRKPPLDTFVRLSGTVEGVFGDTAFLASTQQGYAAGLELWLGSTGATGLAPGQKVDVTGYINTFEGQLEIEAVQPPTVTGFGVVPAPVGAKTGDLSKYDGLLVRVAGTLQESSAGWTVNDGSGAARIRLYAGSAPAGGLVAGRRWSALGVVVEDEGTYGIAPVLSYASSTLNPASTVTGPKDVALATLISHISTYLGTEVRIQSGVVAAVLSHGANIYLEVGDKGMRVYLPTAIRLALRPGDEIAVSGRVTLYEGTPEIDPSVKPRLVGSVAAPAANVVALAKVGQDSLEGYVQVQGTVTKVGNETFVITHNGQSVYIYVPGSSRGILPAQGSQVTVQGVVTLYKGSYQIEATRVTVARA